MTKTVTLWIIASGILIAVALLVSCDNTPSGPQVTITGSENVEVEIIIIEEDGNGDLDIKPCCDEEKDDDDDQCWSVPSGTPVSCKECAANPSRVCTDVNPNE